MRRCGRDREDELDLADIGVIIQGYMDDLAGRDLGLDRVEEADELLLPVALDTASDDLSFEHVEGGK